MGFEINKQNGPRQLNRRTPIRINCPSSRLISRRTPLGMEQLGMEQPRVGKPLGKQLGMEQLWLEQLAPPMGIQLLELWIQASLGIRLRSLPIRPLVVNNTHV